MPFTTAKGQAATGLQAARLASLAMRQGRRLQDSELLCTRGFIQKILFYSHHFAIHSFLAADGHFAKGKMSYGEQELAFLSCVRAALSQQPEGRVPTPPAP